MRLTIGLFLIALFFLENTSASSQTRRPPPRSQYSPLAAQQEEHPQPQRRTWYEVALSRLNPDNVDYGTWMEERRDAFLQATIQNRYFNYALAMTLVSLFLFTAYAKLWSDGKRKEWITAEMMTDLLNHDQHSREVAREAIRKYNDHIERCNRVIEAAESGRHVPGASQVVETLQTKLKGKSDELDAMRKERDQIKRDLDNQKLVLAELSIRTNAVTSRDSVSGGNGMEGQVPPTSSSAGSDTGRLMRHINELETQLYAAKKETDRLKGG